VNTGADLYAAAVVVGYFIQVTVCLWGALWGVSVFKRVLLSYTKDDAWHPLQCWRLALRDEVAGFALGFSVILSFLALRGVLWLPIWILRAFRMIPAPEKGWVLVTGVISALGICAGILFLIHKMSGSLSRAAKEPKYSLWAIGLMLAGTYISYQVFTALR
jgi:hypothetical protein